MKIGVLAIQGSVDEHKVALENLGCQPQEVKSVEDLEGLNGIILPGGESTTQSKLLKRFGIFEKLAELIVGGLPVWGTCAGAILLGKKVNGKKVPDSLGVMDIEVDRNAYGSQADSFDETIEVQGLGPVECVFIRAPKFECDPEKLEVMAYSGEYPVMVRQGHMLATSFHPELTDDLKVHRYFLSLCH